MGREKEGGQKSKYSEESYKRITASKRKYREEHYTEKALRIPQSEKEAWLKAAESFCTAENRDLSLNYWMNEMCRNHAKEQGTCNHV